MKIKKGIFKTITESDITDAIFAIGALAMGIWVFSAGCDPIQRPEQILADSHWDTVYVYGADGITPKACYTHEKIEKPSEILYPTWYREVLRRNNLRDFEHLHGNYPLLVPDIDDDGKIAGKAL